MTNTSPFHLSLVLSLLLLLINPAKAQVYVLDRGLGELTKRLVDNSQLPPRTRLAVVPLVDYKNRETRFGNFVAEELTTRLFAYQRFDLVERQLLDKALKEIKLQNPRAGITDPSTAIKLGKILNAEAILVGSYEDLGYTRKINARIISVERARVLSAAGIEIEKSKIPQDDTGDGDGTTGGAIIEVNQTIYFGGDWLTVRINSIELVAGRYIQFNFTVRNPFEDEIRLRLDQPRENTYLVDNYGNSCDYISSIGIDGYRDREIKPGEKVNCSIAFKAPSSSASYITLRTEWTASGRNVYGTKRFVEKNLPIPGR